MTLKNKENTENGKTITCRWEDLTGGNIPVEMGNCDVMIIENIPDHTSMTSLKKFLTLLPARQITAKTISGKIFTIELTKKTYRRSSFFTIVQTGIEGNRPVHSRSFGKAQRDDQ